MNSVKAVMRKKIGKNKLTGFTVLFRWDYRLCKRLCLSIGPNKQLVPGA